MNRKLFSCTFVILVSIASTTSNHRAKRFLTFPRTSPTRLQVSKKTNMTKYAFQDYC